MPDSLTPLEAQRTELFRQIAAVGDFRRGSITTTSGKCGKPSCHCAKNNDPGHGPNFRLTRKVQGKTITETFDSPTELDKAQREVANFHHFQELCQELIAINERICQLRPPEEALTPQEKKRRKQFSRKSRTK
ncbi:MAG: DUF6788 family protein [Candidatus Sulfotelmatobacter sp.]